MRSTKFLADAVLIEALPFVFFQVSAYTIVHIVGLRA